jgi:uncharacterized damage-inducible protein DinB
MTTQRTDAPLAGDEVSQLRGWLDHHRDTLRLKTEGLDQQQLATPLPPSSLTLGGLLKHLALVEDNWFSAVLLGNDTAEPWRDVDWKGDPDWEFRTAADDSPAELRRLFDEATEASDRILDEVLATDRPDGPAGPGGLDRLSARASRHTGEHFSLRWILLHMIEEYARHNGHADLLREAVDGQTGA